jgi:hypothetical protein
MTGENEMVIEYSQKELMEIILKAFHDQFDYKYHGVETAVSFKKDGEYVCARIRVCGE